MTAPFPFGVTLTVYPQGTQDRWGDTTRGTPFDVPGCAVWPIQSNEPDSTAGRTATATTLGVLGPWGTTIPATAQVEVPGYTGRWQVAGDQGTWTHPMTGWKPGTELRLERVKG